jgi:hypothetical protein
MAVAPGGTSANKVLKEWPGWREQVVAVISRQPSSHACYVISAVNRGVQNTQ